MQYLLGFQQYVRHLPNRFMLNNFSALDKYFSKKPWRAIYILTDCSLITLAKTFENLEFPSLPAIDAFFIDNKKHYYFRCVDNIYKPSAYPCTVQNLLYDYVEDIFYDFYDIYPDLRKKNLDFQLFYSGLAEQDC